MTQNDADTLAVHYRVSRKVVGMKGEMLAQRREVLGTVLFGILLCSTIYVVLDLDRPRRGLIDVSQTPILGFKEAVQSEMSSHP